jgi:kumamolisin
MSEDIREMAESAIRHPQAASRTRDAAPAEQLEVSVYLKLHAQESGGPAAARGPRETRAQMRARRTAEYADDIRAVTGFAAQHGLRLVGVEAERRLVRLAGSVAQFGVAFGTNLGVYDAGPGEYRSYSGNLSAPASLAARIESVLGLDTRPAAQPHFVRQLAPATLTSHRPNEMAALYDFPAGVSGAGECIALIELGGGYHDTDTAAAFAAMSLPTPTVLPVSVDGGTNSPGSPADGEVALDIQVAGGVASGARLAVYFAPNTTRGFVDAITAAAHDTTNRPSIISISWGAPEASWGTAEMTSMNSALQDAATLGLSVFVAAGDSLATDGISDGKAHADYPAASPWAIGCGGTTIDTTGSSVNSEVVWNNSGQQGTGGGISDYAPIPAFQAGIALPPSVNDGGHRRGVPDVAANADPNSGYTIVLDGQTAGFGGTSAVAPLWAGLSGRLNQMMPAAETIGFFLPRLYQFPPVGRDITAGNNKPASEPAVGYNAGPGWDACTGLGAPDGNRLAMILTRTAKIAAVQWSDTSRHIRVYCQDEQNVIQEYCWDGNGPWTPGVKLAGAAPDSQLAAVQWSDPAGVHLRVYYQNPQNIIVEQCYDGSWAPGQGVFPGAAPGTGIAAVQWSDTAGVHLRVYYQNPQNTVTEQCYDGKWAPGQGVFAGAAPTTGIAAVYWNDSAGTHLRVYYQNPQNAVTEQCYDGKWAPGQGVFAGAAPTTGIAAAQWSDTAGVHLRVYYQNTPGTALEQCYDGKCAPGQKFSGTAPGTGVAAVNWNDSAGTHLRVYYQSTQNAVTEQCYDGTWTTGQFVVPTK